LKWNSSIWTLNRIGYNKPAAGWKVIETEGSRTENIENVADIEAANLKEVLQNAVKRID
jgi:hypothetical protein